MQPTTPIKTPIKSIKWVFANFWLQQCYNKHVAHITGWEILWIIHKILWGGWVGGEGVLFEISTMEGDAARGCQPGWLSHLPGRKSGGRWGGHEKKLK
jgi:hypothetical protein